VRAARQRFLAGRERLPSRLLALGSARPPYPVRYSTSLEALCDRVRQTAMDTALAGSPPAVPAVARANVLWGVDLQADFMFPGGRLYVPGAEKIIPNVKRLVDAARRGQVLLVGSTDAHRGDDPELSHWPPHCLKDTPGAELIAEARTLHCHTIPNQRGFSFPVDLLTHQQVILEKNTLDVFDNPNTVLLLDHLSSTPAGSPAFVVFGVATEYCVRCTVEGLLRSGRQVMVVTDAIQALDAEKGRAVLNDLQSRGARLLTTDQALTLLGAPHTSSAVLGFPQ
jgi:nicotinamidase/pyrazinamidase